MEDLISRCMIFFCGFDNPIDNQFCEFLRKPRELQEKAFSVVQGDWKAGKTEEFISKYPCWISLENLLSMLLEAGQTNTMSNSCPHVIMDLCRNANEIAEKTS